jgi:Na+/phosphate symporter
LLGVALPLAAIHLWIEAATQDARSSIGGGARIILQRAGNAVARALAFDSVLTFALGLIIFVLIPYAILFLGHAPRGNKTDFAVFTARLLLVFLFTLVGWIVTLTTMTKLEPPPTVPVSTISEAPVEAAA